MTAPRVLEALGDGPVWISFDRVGTEQLSLRLADITSLTFGAGGRRVVDVAFDLDRDGRRYRVEGTLPWDEWNGLHARGFVGRAKLILP